MAKRREIRNSTAEFLIFQIENKEQGVEVFYKDENVWCTQKAMATLFDCDRSVITKHLGNIFESGELKDDAVCAKFAHTTSGGRLSIENLLTIFYISVTFGDNLFVVRWLSGVTLILYLSLLSLMAKQVVLLSKMPSFAFAKAIFAIVKQLVLHCEIMSLLLRKPILYIFRGIPQNL